MKKQLLTLGVLVFFAAAAMAQNTPKQTPQYNDPFQMMQSMMQKMFGGDSSQQFGFQQFRMNPNDSTDGFNFAMPLDDSNGTMKSFGFSFGNDGWKMMTPDSASQQGFDEMRKRMQDRMPDFGDGNLGSFFKDFEKFFGGQMPFGGPSVMPPNQRSKKEESEEPTNKKKYKTEKL